MSEKSLSGSRLTERNIPEHPPGTEIDDGRLAVLLQDVENAEYERRQAQAEISDKESEAQRREHWMSKEPIESLVEDRQRRYLCEREEQQEEASLRESRERRDKARGVREKAVDEIVGSGMPRGRWVRSGSEGCYLENIGKQNVLYVVPWPLARDSEEPDDIASRLRSSAKNMRELSDFLAIGCISLVITVAGLVPYWMFWNRLQVDTLLFIGSILSIPALVACIAILGAVLSAASASIHGVTAHVPTLMLKPFSRNAAVEKLKQLSNRIEQPYRGCPSKEDASE